MAFAFEIFVILNYAYGSHLIRCTHICSVYQLVQVAVCRLFLSAPPLVDLACWSLPCLPLACPLPSSGGLCGLFYIGIHINYEKIATTAVSLCDRLSQRFGLLVDVVSPAAIAGRVV